MAKTLKEIARLVNGDVVGDENIKITGVAGIEDAGEGDITFLANPKYINYLEKTNASAVIASREIRSAIKPLVLTDNPSLAFTKVVSFILPQDEVRFSGIHRTALVGENVKLGKNVALGPYVVIEDDASIGDNTLIYSHCFVGKKSTIGSDGLIYPNVSIRENTQIKDRVIIHSGAVIGSDGFGFVTVEKKHHKIPQLGTVVIENDVEIGANVTIDRARFDKTLIGEGTKIDNLVHIAHNVTIGKNCLIIAQVGISGSVKIGDNVILAGQAGLAGHLTIGDNSVVMAQTGVAKSLPSGSVVWGTPARPADEVKRAMAAVLNLPKLMETIKELKKKIEGKND